MSSTSESGIEREEQVSIGQRKHKQSAMAMCRNKALELCFIIQPAMIAARLGQATSFTFFPVDLRTTTTRPRVGVGKCTNSVGRLAASSRSLLLQQLAPDTVGVIKSGKATFSDREIFSLPINTFNVLASSGAALLSFSTDSSETWLSG